MRKAESCNADAGFYLGPPSAVKLVTSRPRMGLFPKLQMLKDVQAKTTRRDSKGARPARGLQPSTGAPTPHVLRGSPARRGNAKEPVRVQLIQGRPRSLPLGVGPLTFSRASRRVLSAFSVSSIRPRERPNWYLRSEELRLRGRRASRGILEALKGALPVRGGTYRVRRAWVSSSRARRSFQAGCPRARRHVASTLCGRG